MRTFACLLLFVIGDEQPAPAQNQPPSDLKKLAFEELMDVNMNAVSRKEEPLGPTPAAVTVITAEDIRRSGVTSILEALRLVPGVQVARINASSWAISARGSILRFPTKCCCRSTAAPFTHRYNVQCLLCDVKCSCQSTR